MEQCFCGASSGGQGSGGQGYGGQSYGDDDSSGKKDSVAGKLMEKAGNLFGSDTLQQRGEDKRRGAGGYGGGSDDY